MSLADPYAIDMQFKPIFLEVYMISLVSTFLLLWLFGLQPAFAESGGIESLRETGKAFSAVAKQVSPSVVFIQVESVKKVPASPFGGASPFSDELFRRFFGDNFQFRGQPQGPREERTQGQGSGFVFSLDKGLFSDKAYILTNNHVVEGGDSIRVTFKDGREFKATIKGADPKSDIAVLEIEGADVPALGLGDSAALEVGEWVVAIGNPFGLSHTLTAGIVSAKGRTSLGISDYEDFIQTDAAINPGNSGGPLVNLDGEVVGINTAIFSRSGGYMGVGFAIPINMARGIAEQLLDGGEVKRGFLGVTIQNLTPDLAESFGVKSLDAIIIAQVSPDSPASRAGLQQGDLIVGFEGNKVTDSGSFRNSVSMTPPGTRASLEVIRKGKTLQLTVAIGELNDDQVAEAPASGAVDVLGLTVQTLTPELATQFKARAGEGVVVSAVERGSLAQMAGIDVGTVIYEVNRTPVANAAQFEQLIANSSDKRALLLIGKGNATRFIVLNW
jgi:serine protease Do